MLTIRLQRVGKAKHANYRLIVSEKARDTHDKYVELLGTYNPHDKEKGLNLKSDRIQYWLGVGATTSNTVHNLLVKAGINKEKKAKSVFLSTKRKVKIAEKKKKNEPTAAAEAKPTTPAAV
jgi:small subunit ribosomal protein S16